MGMQLHSQRVESRNGKLPLQFCCSCPLRLKALPHTQPFQRHNENDANQDVDSEESGPIPPKERRKCWSVGAIGEVCEEQDGPLYDHYGHCETRDNQEQRSDVSGPARSVQRKPACTSNQ